MARWWWGDSVDLYRRYHDVEWGRPSDDDVKLFEKLTLEGFMARLSWLTILRKRESFRRAFRGFTPAVVARFGARDVSRLMADAGIVRTRAKIDATINNARRYSDLLAEFGSFAAYVWSFEPKPRRRMRDRSSLMNISSSDEAIAMSKDLRRWGWAFVGPTRVYSFMQAMGVLNDHVEGCNAGAEVERLRRVFVRPAVKR